MNVSVEGVSYSVQDKQLIDSILLHVRKGELVGLIGPNGSGKSTLLKNIYRVLQPDSGRISIDGQNLHSISHRETARQIAVVSQEAPVAFDFSVKDMVLMGRNPHKKWYQPDSGEDLRLVEQALERVGLLQDVGRSFSTLSGGEKQRVLIARALAQQARFLILDEPTNHLDIKHQLQIMDLVKGLKITSLAALHDLNIAACYCDRLVVMKDGKVIVAGTPEEILKPELLFTIFEVATEVVRHPMTGKPLITFLPEMSGMENISPNDWTSGGSHD